MTIWPDAQITALPAVDMEGDEFIAGDCEGDFNYDGDVDGSDLAVFAADFGRTDCLD